MDMEAALSCSSNEDLEAEEDVSVFETAEALTDVTFEVEGRKLHFWKLLLRIASPVFEGMFASDGKEEDCQEIPLPGKKFADVDIFLQNMHPAYAWEHLTDDETLEVLLLFAHEYQIDHIRRKCLGYINGQIGRQQFRDSASRFGASNSSTSVSDKSVILYVSLCEQFQLEELRSKLISAASHIRLEDLEHYDRYKGLSDTCKLDIMRARCRRFESKHRSFY